MRKKILGLIMFMVFVVGCLPSGYAAENIELSDIRCEGIGDKAQISGTLSGVSNDTAFINIFEGDSWEALRETEDYDKLKYFGGVSVDENGKFDLTVGIISSGEYRFEIKGFKNSDISVTGKLYYINSTEKAQVSKEIKGISLDNKDTAKIMISNKIKQYKNAFGLFDGLYDETVLDDASEIIYNSIKDVDVDNVSLCVNKAFVAAQLNAKVTTDIDVYKHSLGLAERGIEKYYKKSGVLTEKLLTEKYTSAEQFDKKLMASLIGISVEYSDGTAAIEELIAKSGDYLSAAAISKVANSDTIAKAMINESDKSKFYTFSGIENYINAYTEPKNNTSGGNGGGGGGGGTAHNSGSIGKGTTTMPITSPETPQTHRVFSDVAEDFWARDMIEDLYRKGIVAGKTETEFYPEDSITREEFVKLLVASINVKADGTEIAFNDVKTDDWFYPYVNIAFNAEIIKGISEDMFGTGNPITRQDLAVMTYNAMSVCEINIPNNGSDAKFVDEDDISDYAKEAVSALKNAGILSGDENGTFRPNDGTTRAEAAKIIYTVLTLNQK